MLALACIDYINITYSPNSVDSMIIIQFSFHNMIKD